MSNDSEHQIPEPPESLGERGTRLWEAVTGTYGLRPDELEILSSACRTADHIARMELELVGQPATVHGSQKQPVINPLLSELRFYRQALTSTLRALAIPDADDDEDAGIPAKLSRSEAARVAARARWGTR